MKVSKEVYERLLNHSIDYKQNKYKNKKVKYDGIEFDSQKEGNEYLRLKRLKNLGLIKDLELQKEYVLQPSFKLNGKTYRKISYYADFSYITTQDNKLHIVDVKSKITAKDKVYRIKKKMMAYIHNIEVEEV